MPKQKEFMKFVTGNLKKGGRGPATITHDVNGNVKAFKGSDHNSNNGKMRGAGSKRGS